MIMLSWSGSLASCDILPQSSLKVIHFLAIAPDSGCRPPAGEGRASGRQGGHRDPSAGVTLASYNKRRHLRRTFTGAGGCRCSYKYLLYLVAEGRVAPWSGKVYSRVLWSVESKRGRGKWKKVTSVIQPASDSDEALHCQTWRYSSLIFTYINMEIYSLHLLFSEKKKQHVFPVLSKY